MREVRTLTKTEEKKVLSLFKKTTKNARTIAKQVKVPRHVVMRFLESQRLASYSDGSYS